MDKFDELELNGRKLLESFLIQVGATNLYPTEDKYAPVDYYFTYKDKKVVAEIKVRDIKYEGYDTHLMEVSKYKSLVKDEKDSQSDTAYYINFFTDGTKVNAYWYSVSSIRNFGTIDYKYCPTTTAVDNGNYYKKVIMIPSNKAQRFALVNGRWNNVLDSKP